MNQKDHNFEKHAVEMAQMVIAEAVRRPALAQLLLRRPAEWVTRLGQRLHAFRRLHLHALTGKLVSGLAAALLAFSLAGPVQPAYAGTITVDGTTCTLKDAITTANSGSPTGGCTGSSGDAAADTINLTVDLTIAALGRLPVITTPITIDGNNHLVDGNGLYRLFDVNGAGASLTLNDLTVMNGLDSGGGGIQVSNGSLTLNNCVVTNNYSEGSGAGILVSGNGSTLTITDSTISNNQMIGSNSGAGLYMGTGTTGVIERSTFSNNVATLYGGGIFTNGTLELVNTTISGNRAGEEGSEYGGGGGIAEGINGELTLNFSTISANATYANGGGIYMQNNLITASASIIAGNTSSMVGGYANCTQTIAFDSGYNIGSGDDCGFTNPLSFPNVALTGTGGLNLAALSNNGSVDHPDTHAVTSTSFAWEGVASGAVGCKSVVSVDARGGVRADGLNRGGSKCEIGAYEDTHQNPTAVMFESVAAAVQRTPALLLAAFGAAFAAMGALIWKRQR